MKIIIAKFGIMMTMLLSFLTSSAYDFEVDGIYYEMISTSDLTCRVVRGETKYQGDVNIPSKVNFENKEITVTDIGSAFRECTSLTSVTIPNSVTNISSAFQGCTSLTSVTIPNSVTNISDAFRGCTSLTSVTIPNSVTGMGGAFQGCTSLTSVTIPDSVTEIYATFSECTSLTNVTIPDSVTEIGEGAFEGCTSLTSVTIPDLVTEIGEDTFKGCTSLTSVTIPNSVMEIAGHAFKGCTSLTSVTIPDSMKKIGSDAFYGCTSLTSITIPNSVKDLGEYAFYGCTSLTSVTILDSAATEIQEGTFKGCTSLSKLTIPGSVREIDSHAFDGCHLTELTILYGSTSFPYNFLKFKEKLLSVEKLFIDRKLKVYDRLEFPNLKEYTMGEHIVENQIKLGDSKELEMITSLASTPPNLKTAQLNDSQYENVIVIVPSEYLEDYKRADYWKNFWNLQVTGIEDVEPESCDRIETGRYNLGGQRVDGEYEGIVIVRYSDGSSKKLLQRK